MKITLISCLLAFFLLTLGWCTHIHFESGIPVSERDTGVTYLIKNMDNIRTLPPGFRLMSSAYQRHLGYIPTRKGLHKLHASGSSQFSKRSLKAILKTIPMKKVIVIDLRQEDHGFFDGMAVSWYGYHNLQNEGKAPEQIQREEELLIKEVQASGFTRIYNDKQAVVSQPFHVKEALSERELAADLNLSYIRYYVTDHKRPDNATIDSLVNLFKTIPDDTWMHFHCAGGKGRTTSFLIMYDMFKNAQDVSFEDIIRRQWFLGGADLSSNNPNSRWKHGFAYERLEFLKDFYNYCRAHPNFEISWSQFSE